MSDLSDFYAGWADRPAAERDFDIETCVEKSAAALALLEHARIGRIASVLEVGCGFGRNVFEVTTRLDASFGLGCDISAGAIDYARTHYASERISYITNASLDITSTVSEVRSVRSQPFDLLLLFDVLEHVPNPKRIIRELAPLTKHFLIKLPLENSIFDNYFLPHQKDYPSARHPDGHLREFHVNDVHAFLVSLGLVPVAYDYYKYRQALLFPRFALPRRAAGRLSFEYQRFIKCCARLVLPKRIFLRVIGGGGFVCLCTWAPQAVFE